MASTSELTALLKRMEENSKPRGRQIPLIEKLTSKDDYPI
jgi:hypothetical protein